MTVTQLGRVQLLIMQVLWDKGKATAREITEAVNAIEPIAHSTVQTLLRGLEEKRAVGYRVEGRVFIFTPLIKQDKFQQSATRDLLDRVFGGDAASLVAHLLKSEKVSEEELAAIRKLVNARSKDKRGE